MNLLADFWERRPLGPGDRCSAWTSPSFDVSVYEIFSALAAGAALLFPAEEVRTSTGAFVRWLSTAGITAAYVPPFMLEELAAEAERAPGAFPLRRLLVGVEPIPEPLLARIAVAIPGVCIVNGYGPTETTVCATLHAVDPAAAREGNAPIGGPVRNTRVLVLDAHLRPVPAGVPGELYAGGAGLARGYLGRAELTAERFVPDPLSGEPGARLYRTGDRVRWRDDGVLEWVGRVDQQLKVRGFRVEPGEVEAVLLEHPGVRRAVVTAPEDGAGRRRLAAYVVPEAEGSCTAGSLESFLRERLPAHMVPAAFVVLDALPLTPGGKTDRRALPAPEALQGDAEELVMPRTEAERTLAAVWSEVLRVERVGVHDDFFALGGDSIVAIQLSSRAARAGLRFSLRELFRSPTVAALARVASRPGVADAEQGAVEGPVPLTPVQAWFLARELPEPHHFNHAMLLEPGERLDAEVLRGAVAALLEHHDALRLRFAREGGTWTQRCAAPGGEVPFERVDLSALPDAALREEIGRAAAGRQGSLDLEHGPLVRAVLFDAGPERAQRVLLVVHHLAVDAVSWGVLLEDLESACRQLSRGEAPRLPEKTTSFRRWAERLHAYARSEEPKTELPFWTEQARAAAPLPVDLAGGENTAGSARTVVSTLGEEETRALLTGVPAAYRTQVNDVLLCALAQAFRAWTGERTLRIHLEGHGREDLFPGVELGRTVGWFTSLFPVRLELEGEEPGEALGSVKEQLRAIPRRGIGYGVLRHLSDDPEVREALARAPEPEVSFNYLGQLGQGLSGESLFRPAREPVGPGSSPLGRRAHLLEVDARVSGGRLQVGWTYGEHVHARATVERLAEEYARALRTLIAHCTAPGAGGLTPSDFPLARISRAGLDRLA
ncbi:MAG TPA: condensation domain-containing protein, partial [Longimicrobiaceae bacterium]|nr:condensation domain-containing protein [Longimicrobiaceae bacterium]